MMVTRASDNAVAKNRGNDQPTKTRVGSFLHESLSAPLSLNNTKPIVKAMDKRKLVVRLFLIFPLMVTLTAAPIGVSASHLTPNIITSCFEASAGVGSFAFYQHFWHSSGGAINGYAYQISSTGPDIFGYILSLPNLAVQIQNTGFLPILVYYEVCWQHN